MRGDGSGERTADTRRLAALLLACGLDPARCSLFVQSHVPGHAELAWLLGCLTGMGELRRMTQFKAKSGDEDAASAGLFTYPVLQAADILLYRAERVPVGEDQRQHLELARDLAERLNRRKADLFPLPAADLPAEATRVVDLQRPSRKMSTTGGTERGTLFLLDPPEVIASKVRAAVTDPGREVLAGPERPGLSNLLGLLSAATGRPVPALEERFRGRGYAALKAELTEALVTLTMPIRSRFRQLEAAGFAGVEETPAAGAEAAQRLAGETLSGAKAAMGLLPPRVARADAPATPATRAYASPRDTISTRRPSGSHR